VSLLDISLTTIPYRFLLVGGVIILVASVFMLPSLLNQQQSAFPTFPGENGKIFFSSTREGNTEIYVMNAADGSGQTRLTRRATIDWDPDWSPDGTKIAFTIASGSAGSDEIYVMNAADGSGQRNKFQSG
jgi:Tol biopolymer transport system component